MACRSWRPRRLATRSAARLPPSPSCRWNSARVCWRVPAQPSRWACSWRPSTPPALPERRRSFSSPGPQLRDRWLHHRTRSPARRWPDMTAPVAADRLASGQGSSMRSDVNRGFLCCATSTPSEAVASNAALRGRIYRSGHVQTAADSSCARSARCHASPAVE
jgi:hypothetical protein